MTSLQYRALLVDPGSLNQDRPQQIFGTSLSEMDEWIQKVLSKAVSPDAVVIIYRTTEQELSRHKKPKVEAAGGSAS